MAAEKSLSLLILLACLEVSQAAIWDKPSPIMTSPSGVRSIGWSDGKGCAWEISSDRADFLRISVQSEACDPASPEVQPVIARQAARLMEKHPRRGDLTVDLYLFHSPLLLKRWAEVLKNSSEWAKRPKRKNNSDTAEYPLIVKLMHESHLFSAYDPLFKRLGGVYARVEVEKVVYESAGDFSFYEEALQPLGYAKEDRIPVPMMTRLIMARRL